MSESQTEGNARRHSDADPKIRRRARRKTLLKQGVRFAVTKDGAGRGGRRPRGMNSNSRAEVKSWGAMSGMAHSDRCWRAVTSTEPQSSHQKGRNPPAFLICMRHELL